MLIKNAPVKLLLTALPCQVCAWFLAAISHFIHGRGEAGILILKALWSVLRDLRWFLEQRKEIRSSIVGSEQVILGQIMRNPGYSYYFNRFKHYITKGTHG